MLIFDKEWVGLSSLSCIMTYLVNLIVVTKINKKQNFVEISFCLTIINISEKDKTGPKVGHVL